MATISDEARLDRLLLPLNPPQYGPITRRLVWKTDLTLIAMFVVGGLLALLSSSPVLKAAGMSMMFPGGGFLYLGWPSLWLLSILAMAFAFLMWWALSAFFTLPLAWFLSIAGSTLLANSPRFLAEPGATWKWALPVVAGTAVVSFAAAKWSAYSFHAKKVAQIADTNEYLKSTPIPQASGAPFEPTDFDREMLAWMYELCLQPDDSFDGFDWGEQYHGGTCLRYQITQMGEVLTGYAANALPNHQQWIEPAMAKLIERMTDRRVWEYWQVENFLAYGDTDPDPVIKDNVMLTGFYQSQISVYVAATGSTRFDEPGCLKFIWKDGRTFAYDHKTMCDAIVDNLEKSKYGLYACEPKWIFTICNAMAAQGLIGYDRTHGTDYWGQVSERFKKGLVEEMMTADGAFRHIRSDALGMSVNDGDGSGEYYLSGSHFFEDLDDDLYDRGKLLTLRGVPEKMKAMEALIKDGVLDHHFPDKKERATYIPSSVKEWMEFVTAAYAVGNDAVAGAAIKALQRDCGTGERFPDRPIRGGVQHISMLLWSHWGRPLSLGQLNLRGYVPPKGPILAHAPWPEIIVTKARSDDGETLDLVLDLYKGEPGKTHALRFTDLQPCGRYWIGTNENGQHFESDEQGRGTVELTVDGEARLTLRPDNA